MRSPCTEDKEFLTSLFRRYAPFAGAKAGIVGYGTFGKKVAGCARDVSMHILLCDPLLQQAESEDVFDAFQESWGNGMGRCYYSDTLTETFFPLSHLVKECDILAVQIPENEKNISLITPEIFSRMKPHALIFNFSSKKIIPFEDERILFFGAE